MAQIHVRWATALGGLFLIATVSGQAHAGSGFAVRSQSTSTLGTAQSGMSTGAGDIATMVYNPATLAAESGNSASFGATGIVTRGRFEDPKGQNVLGGPISGGSGGNNWAGAPLPNVHLGFDVGQGLRAGFSLTSHYGLGTFYDDGWVGRYHALDSQLISVAAQPTVAWQATPWLALGAGVLLQYTQTTTTAALDFATIDVLSTGGAFGGIPGADDGRIKSSMSDFAPGFSVGALVEPRPGTRIGVGYRSAMTHDLDGDATFDLGGPVGAGLAAATGGFSDTGVSAKLRLPPQIFAGIQQELGHGVTVYGDLNWLGWSRLDDLTLTFDNPAQPAVPIDLPWKNSIYFAAGMSWEATEKLTIRGGAAYDQSASRDKGATPAIPDGDAIWVSAGMNYQWTDRLSIDSALGATFTEQVNVDLDITDPGNTFRGAFDGSVGDAGAAFASVQLNLEF